MEVFPPESEVVVVTAAVTVGVLEAEVHCLCLRPLPLPIEKFLPHRGIHLNLFLHAKVLSLAVSVVRADPGTRHSLSNDSN